MKNQTTSSKGIFGGFRGFCLNLRRANRKRVVLFLSAALLVVMIFGLLLALLIIDFTQRGKIFPGITIDGRQVGGMSREEAASYIASSLVAPISEPMVLYYDDEEFILDLSSIDLTVDVDSMVDQAHREGMGRNVLERMSRRLLNKPIRVDVPLTMSYDEAKLEEFVVEVARNLNYASRSAGIDMSEGHPIVSYSRDGLEVQQGDTLRSITSALPTDKRKLPVVTEVLKPEISDEEIKYIVVVKQGEHTLFLYEGETLEGSFPVALVSPEYPTPNGKFYIIKKEKDPTWYPPKSEWAKDEEPIPPGPGNPLGPYWMAIGDGIGIHATPDAASLGYSVSHGCIRMSEWGAQQLFNKVKVGTPIYIIAAPEPPPTPEPEPAPVPEPQESVPGTEDAPVQ